MRWFKLYHQFEGQIDAAGEVEVYIGRPRVNSCGVEAESRT